MKKFKITEDTALMLFLAMMGVSYISIFIYNLIVR